MNLTIIAAAIAAAIGFGAAWRIQGSTITEMRLQDALRRSTESHEAFRRIENDTTQIAVAQSKKVVRDSVNLSDAANARSSGDGLRLASADTVRAAQASASACYDTLARYGIVLDEVVKAGAEMAVDSDRLASELTLLQDSWPK